MPPLRNRQFCACLRSFGAAVLPLALLLTSCGPDPAAQDQTTTPVADLPRLGVMTSLPLYWQQGAELSDLAAGLSAPTWQRIAIEQRYAMVPLDTLTPVPALSPELAEVDPLAGITRLAVIQPRGLSPADNAALDTWVRGGGRLLLALDPALTGNYDAPFGDPRRPVDTALIPPVAARWGLSVRFDPAQSPQVTIAALAGAPLPLALAGQLAIIDPAAAECVLTAGGAAATCRVGAGRVTLIADAALFEHRELAGEGGAGLRAVLAAAFD